MVLIQNSKVIWNVFEKEFENGFEIKEKKEKKIRKIRVFLNCKVYLGKPNKIVHFYLNREVYLKLYLNLI